MVARCQHVEAFGSNGYQAQCLRADPHPDEGHLYPVDSLYGVDLNTRKATWLASELRMTHQMVTAERNRVDEATRVALNLARVLGEVLEYELRSLPADLDDHRLAEAKAFLLKRAPDTAAQIGWTP